MQASGLKGVAWRRNLCIAISLGVLLMSVTSVERAAAAVEQWDIFEVELKGPAEGNPFVDVTLEATFKHKGGKEFKPAGFYDGEGVYRIRFMPDAQGQWTYATKSNAPALAGKTGEFTCAAPAKGNHGPVRVRNKYYFAYADGAPYFQVGTTCYAWAHQTNALEDRTLKTLKTAPFNKLRMCVFPKHYTYNQNEPQYYPFEGKPLKDWDFARFNPAFFRHFEQRVGDLRDLGIEADLILFHPYDRWGYQHMTAEQDDRYLRYVAARLSAYRNVWWSMANEYDLMKSKKMEDWDRIFQVVRDSDPYNHMRGNHNCRGFYDHTKPWVTHCSIQNSQLHRTQEWREQYGKPALFDECRYEGDVKQGWGNQSAQEMVRKFWLGAMGGGYVGHGETFNHPQDILWWSKGGVLHGESPARIAFFKKIMEPTPFEELQPNSKLSPGNFTLSQPGALYFIYCTSASPVELELAGERPYKVDGIDTWDMTVSPLSNARPGRFALTPPKADFVLRLTAYRPGEKLRPEARPTASAAEGVAPLAVTFAANSELKRQWDFGDGATSTDAQPAHTYAKAGMYKATLTVTGEDGQLASAPLFIAVEGQELGPLVRVGFKEDETPRLKLQKGIKRTDDGGYDFGAKEPWKWIEVGDQPLKELEGLRSFTILGWARPDDLEIGPGGNRFAFSLNHNRGGFDLVHQADGRLRLAVNEWPDRVKNDSSPKKLRVGEWTFFAVTYDSTKSKDNVCFYFGGDGAPAALDRRSTYNRGATGADSGPLTIGNYNQTLHGSGKDRQFRGRLRGVEIHGSRISGRGALSLDAIRQRQ